MFPLRDLLDGIQLEVFSEIACTLLFSLPHLKGAKCPQIQALFNLNDRLMAKP